MYRPRYERISRLRRFVSRRAKGPTGDLPSLIAEATRLLLLPSLRDVLDGEASEPVELRLTYACACVVLVGLLAQRFAPRQAEAAGSGAIRRIGDWSGLDDARLTERASATIRQLTETHPEVHRALCGQFDDAVERAIVLGRPAQGEVLLRLALESLEAAIQRLVLGRDPAGAGGLIRSSGLLRVVTRRSPGETGGPIGEAPPARAPARRPPAPRQRKSVKSVKAVKAPKRSEERAGRQRRRIVILAGLVDRWRRDHDPRSDDPSS